MKENGLNVFQPKKCPTAFHLFEFWCVRIQIGWLARKGKRESGIQTLDINTIRMIWWRFICAFGVNVKTCVSAIRLTMPWNLSKKYRSPKNVSILQWGDKYILLALVVCHYRHHHCCYSIGWILINGIRSGWREARDFSLVRHKHFAVWTFISHIVWHSIR